MTLSSHPVKFAEALVQKHGENLLLSFSRYFYRPASVFDERLKFSVPGRVVTPAWLEAELANLPDGWELAVNSHVKDERGRTFHVGLIDFAEGASRKTIEVSVRNLLGEDALRHLWLYDSGRSFHGYLFHLMIPKDWRAFLGRLLLMNQVDASDVVDARWVGHRLVGGYCALRWSMNTEWYKQMPSRVR